MKKLGVFLSFLIVSLAAYGAIPWEIPNNDMKVGDGSVLTSKSLEMRMGLGAANPIFSSLNGSEMNVNIPFRVQGNLTVEGDGLVNGSVTLGDGTAVDRTLLVNRGGSNPFLRWSESAGSWIFSNDGTLEKKIGSGSGGGGGGINLLLNPSFEDPGAPILNWSNAGGTFTQETHTNGREGNIKFARLVASAAAQSIESDAVTISDDMGPGCMARFKYKQGGGVFDYKVLKSPYADPADVVSSGSVSNLTEFLQAPTIRFNCAGGGLFRLRITSTAAGTIDVDEAYLGSNDGFTSGTYSNSLNLFGNGDEVITANTQDIPFVGTGVGWSASSYTVQRNGSIVTISGSVAITVSAFIQTSVYKNGTLYKIIGNDPSSDYHKIEYTSESGEFLKDDVISIRMNSTRQLINNATKHYLTIVERSGETQEAYSPEQADFFVDVNIGGANPALSNVGGVQQEIINASLDMVLNKGSAKIPCSLTNPSSGLTCAAGSESIGVVFSAPLKGDYDICASFIASTNGTNGFRLVHTDNNSQNVLFTGNMVSSTANIDSTPNYVCSRFNFSNIGEKTIRLFYTGNAAGSILMDRDVTSTYARDVNITVRLVSHNSSRPIIQNMVDTSVGSGVRVNHCLVSAAGGTPTSSYGSCASWIASYTDRGVGAYTVNLNVGVYGTDFSCNANWKNDDATGLDRGCSPNVTGPTTIEVDCRKNNAYVDADFYFTCTGDR